MQPELHAKRGPATALGSSDYMLISLVVLTILVGIIAYALIRSSRDVLIAGTQGRIDLQALIKTTIDQETGMRGYAATGDVLFLQPYQEGTALYESRLAALRKDLQFDVFRGALPFVARYDALHARWIRVVVRPLIARPRGPHAHALQIEGKGDVDAMRAEADGAERVVLNVLGGTGAAVDRTIVGSIAAIVLLTIVLGTAALRKLRARYAEEHALRAQIADRNEALERSNQALQEFAYVASHDLQEPLRTVASFTQLLQKRYAGKLDAEADEFIEYAVDGARRMQTLVNDILRYSRVTTHGEPLHETDLQVSVERAIANLRTAVAERSAVIELGEFPPVVGDANQLTQLFQNLIGNAIKYNASSVPRIDVTSSSSDGTVTVVVRDNGIGIDPEYHERVFKLFSRLHTRAEYAGTGIGLALCKRIVERHGGRIWIDSSEGHGATFSLTLRRAGESSL